MVFRTLPNFCYAWKQWRNACPGPPKFWNRRRTKIHTATFYGRRRNCYRVAIRAMIRAFNRARIGRRDRARDLKDLYVMRVTAGCSEYHIQYKTFREGLDRSLILLRTRVLSDLAIWEPRTFKALTDVAKRKAHEDEDLEYPAMNPEDIAHFIDRGILQKKV